MKRFVFPLETLLGYRERLEGLAENEYRRVQAELNRARERLAELQDRRRALLNRHSIRPGTGVDPRWLEMLSRCAGQMEALAQLQRGVVCEREQEAARRLDDWHRRRREAEVIRRLKAKRHRAWIREGEREEQIVQDDLFIAKLVREGRQ